MVKWGAGIYDVWLAIQRAIDQKRITMKKKTFFLISVISAVASGSLLADTLELAEGALLEGDFVGSSNGIVMFDTGEGIEAFPESEVVGIYLSDGVATAAAHAAKSNSARVTIPSGSRLVIRTTEDIDSRRHSAGHRFRGQLESALVVDGITVAPRGTFVHGRVAQAKQAGRVVGSSELAIEFTDIMIDDQLFPITTTGLVAQSGGEGRRTVGRTARSAALGGLIGGSSGARTGAKVGAGVSILTRGTSINIPRGTIVEARLSAPVTIEL